MSESGYQTTLKIEKLREAEQLIININTQLMYLKDTAQEAERLFRASDEAGDTPISLYAIKHLQREIGGAQAYAHCLQISIFESQKTAE